MTTVHRNGIIEMIRGDSFECPISINVGSLICPQYYHLQEEDKLYFGLMQPNEKFENAIVKKVYNKDSAKSEDGNVLLKFSPDDTLKLASGKYYYMLKLLHTNGTVHTVVEPTLFYIKD